MCVLTTVSLKPDVYTGWGRSHGVEPSPTNQVHLDKILLELDRILRVEDTHEVSEKEPWSISDQAMAHVSSQDMLSGDDDGDHEQVITGLSLT